MLSYQCVLLVKEIVVSGAALTGAIVACNGLSAWKAQAKGQRDERVSHQLLVSLYELIDAINHLRTTEACFGIDLPILEESRKTRSIQYNKEIEKVNKANNLMRANLLEAEAFWGEEINRLFDPIEELRREVESAAIYRINVIEGDTESKLFSQKMLENTRPVFYSLIDSQQPDGYSNELEKSVKKIEGYLREKLI